MSMIKALFIGLCIVGFVLEAALIAGIGVGVGRLLLWWADFRGNWLDEHPVKDESAKVPGRKNA